MVWKTDKQKYRISDNFLVHCGTPRKKEAISQSGLATSHFNKGHIAVIICG